MKCRLANCMIEINTICAQNSDSITQLYKIYFILYNKQLSLRGRNFSPTVEIDKKADKCPENSHLNHLFNSVLNACFFDSKIFLVAQPWAVVRGPYFRWQTDEDTYNLQEY